MTLVLETEAVKGALCSMRLAGDSGSTNNSSCLSAAAVSSPHSLAYEVEETMPLLRIRLIGSSLSPPSDCATLSSVCP